MSTFFYQSELEFSDFYQKLAKTRPLLLNILELPISIAQPIVQWCHLTTGAWKKCKNVDEMNDLRTLLTNTFVNFDKIILLFGQRHFVIWTNVQKCNNQKVQYLRMQPESIVWACDFDRSAKISNFSSTGNHITCLCNHGQVLICLPWQIFNSQLSFSLEMC